MGGVMVPLYPEDERRFKKLTAFDVVYKDFKKARNPLFHRKGFALLNVIFENQEFFNDFEEFRKSMKIKCGLTREWIEDDKVHIEIGSMSFDAMDEYEFQALYERIKTNALEHYLPSTWSDEEINRLVNIIINQF